MIPDRLQYFLDDFWNFENFIKIWTVYLLTITKNASKNTRTYGRILENVSHPGIKNGKCLKSRVLFFCNLRVSHFILYFMKTRTGKYADWLNKIYKSFWYEFHIYQNMKWKFGNTYQISSENIQHFRKQETKTKKQEPFFIFK